MPDDGMHAETVHTILVDQRVESVHHEATRLHLSTLKAKSDKHRREHPGRLALGRSVIEVSAALPEQTSLEHPTSSKNMFFTYLIKVRIAQELEQSILLDE